MKMNLKYNGDRECWEHEDNSRILFCCEVMDQLGLIPSPVYRYEMQVETVPIEGGTQVELSRSREMECSTWEWTIEGVISETANIFCTAEVDRMIHFLFPTKRNGTVWIKFTEIP